MLEHCFCCVPMAQEVTKTSPASGQDKQTLPFHGEWPGHTAEGRMRGELSLPLSSGNAVCRRWQQQLCVRDPRCPGRFRGFPSQAQPLALHVLALPSLHLARPEQPSDQISSRAPCCYSERC